MLGTAVVAPPLSLHSALLIFERFCAHPRKHNNRTSSKHTCTPLSSMLSFSKQKFELQPFGELGACVFCRVRACFVCCWCGGWRNRCLPLADRVVADTLRRGALLADFLAFPKLQPKDRLRCPKTPTWPASAAKRTWLSVDAPIAAPTHAPAAVLQGQLFGDHWRRSGALQLHVHVAAALSGGGRRVLLCVDARRRSYVCHVSTFPLQRQQHVRRADTRDRRITAPRIVSARRSRVRFAAVHRATRPSLLFFLWFIIAH